MAIFTEFGRPKKSPLIQAFSWLRYFALADRVGISQLQNAVLNAIRARVTGQHISPSAPNTTDEIPQSYGICPDGPSLVQDSMWGTSPEPEKSDVKYLPPATFIAIQHAYRNTLEGSSLRGLLTDIFAFNVKAETLEEDILALPTEFIADVVIINMKRLPLRLGDEKAHFDKGAEQYYVQDTRLDRKSRVFQENLDEISADKAADDEQIDSWGKFQVGKPSKHKKKGKRARKDIA